MNFYPLKSPIKVLVVFAMLFLSSLMQVNAQIYEIDAFNGQTISTCSGSFRDSNRRNGGTRYNDNEFYSVTFTSNNGNALSFNFTSFDVEGNGASACYDELRVYDGANASASLIGVYCNSNIPSTITSTGTSLHFVFESDGSVRGTGWVAAISCISVVDPCNPVASGNLDSDGDGVSDVCDLDDDNDGILDTQECVNFLEGGGFNIYDDGSFIYGNNFVDTISPWQLGGGQRANIVKVDGILDAGPNPYIGGPYEDANPDTGAGEDQYYLDIASGSNDFYQAFTFTEETQVTYSGYFSARDNGSGTGSISIRQGTGIGGTIVDTSGTITVNSGGDSQNAGWTYFERTIVLPIGTYSFVISMSDPINFDEAAITRCPDSDGDGIFDYLDLDSDNDGCTDEQEYGYDPKTVIDDGTNACMPVAQDDVFTVCQKTATKLAVFDDNGNGIDDFRVNGPSGSGAYIAITSPPTNGTATIVLGAAGIADDVIEYTSNPGTTTDSFQYTITDDTGDTDTATVTITVNPSPDISTTDTPMICASGGSFDLSTLAISDANSTSATYTYHSATPATSANELASTIVSPVSTTDYYVLATTGLGCRDELAVTVTVDDEAPVFTTAAGSLDLTFECADEIPSSLPSCTDINTTYFNEAQYSWGIQIQNTTGTDIDSWKVIIDDADYTLDYSQLSNNSEFTYSEIDNGDGTYDLIITGTGAIVAYGSTGNIEWTGVNFGFDPTSKGIFFFCGTPEPVFTPPVATDNCSSPTVSIVSDITTAGSCGNSFVRVITYQATDALGNTSAAYKTTITVSDTEAPTASNLPAEDVCAGSIPPPDITLVNDEVDNCTSSPTVAHVNDVTTGNVVTRTYSVTDECGNSTNITQIFNINNNTVGAASSTPTLCVNSILTDITHVTTGATGIGVVSNLPAGVTASWAGDVITITGTPTERGTFNYDIPLTGGCGAISATGTIIVNEVPSINTTDTPITCPSGGFDLSTLAITDANSTGATYTYHSTTPADGANILASSTVSPATTTTYYVLATTANGCTDELAVTVTVVDNINPTISACPSAVTVNVDAGTCTASGVSLGAAPTGTDNCGVPTITNDAPATFPIGDTTVTWTSTDAAGNTATCTQVVTVVDNINPTISACPSAVTVNVDAGTCTASGVSLGA
ncbi:HYR domain-containing protein, partial [Tenacibaculum adriaticum]